MTMWCFWCLTLAVLPIQVLVETRSIPNGQEFRCLDYSKHRNWRKLDRVSDCGKIQTNETSGRIMGGTEADIGEFPWIVKVLGRSRDKHNVNQTICGGSIINKRYVLTAAHCGRHMDDPTGARWEVFAVVPGAHRHNILENMETKIGAVQIIRVESAIYHPNFTYIGALVYNDICLLRLKTDLQFNEYIFPICLPTSCDFQQNKYTNPVMVAAGWGVLRDGENGTQSIQPDALEKVELEYVTREECQVGYKDLIEIRPTQVCAGKNLSQSVCHGDSGGPLMKYETTEGSPRNVIVGIMSFGAFCIKGRRISQNVFTNVASYLDWILSNID